MNKKFLVGGITGALVLAGGVSAFALFNSPKEAYLYAEYKTANSAIEKLEQRFEEDIKWSDIVNTDATKMDMEISASVEDDAGYLEYEIVEAINSSSIDVTVQSNPQENTYALSVGAKILDFTIDPFTAYVTDKKMIGEMPFQEEALEMSLEKLSELSGEENACMLDEDFERIMKQQDLLTEEDLKHIQKEILPEIYKAIPDKAFEKDGNQLTMQLTGSDIENLLDVAVNTLAQDEVVKRVINDAIIVYDQCGTYTVDKVLDEMKAEISAIEVDSSTTIKSVITVNNLLIVDRKLYIKDELVLKGTQNLKSGIVFDYEFIDPEYGTTATVKGKIGTGKNIRDEIEISNEGEMFLHYEGKETNNKKKRDFSRALTVNDGNDKVTFNWDGTQSFAGDGNVSDNKIYFEIPDQGKLSLYVKTDSQKTKGFDLPSNTVDLTGMSESEIEQYFQNEVAENFMSWTEELMYELGDLLY